MHFDGRTQLERLKLDVSSWLLGMIVIAPLWALIEWQDNGAFERWSNNSRPGDWEPWILYVGGRGRGAWRAGVGGLATRYRGGSRRRRSADA